MVVFIVAGTGGAEAINEIIKEIRTPIKVLAFSDYSYKKITNTTQKRRLNQCELKKALDKINPKLVFSERSNHIDFQKKVTKLCQQKRIPNVIVMDNNLLQDKGVTGAEDYITVVDSKSKEYLKSIDINNNKIIKLGNPSFAKIKELNYTPQFPEDPNILFTSQGGKGNIKHEKQVKIFNKMYKQVVEGLKVHNPKVDIKLHPMESEFEGRWIKDTENYKNVNILNIRPEIDFFKELIKYDLVLGFNSTLQVQSYLAGIPTIFYHKKERGEYEKYKNKELPLSKELDLEKYYKYNQKEISKLINRYKGRKQNERTI